MAAAAFSTKSTKHYNVRCISLPARSHPVAVKIEEELNKLKSWDVSSSSSSSNGEKICSGIEGLGELYRCMCELFGLPLIQEALALHQHEKNYCWVNDFLDGLLMYLDICGSTRDAVLMIKQSVRELQSALRRSKGGGGGGDLSMIIDGNVNAYICSRKKMKKEIITKCFASLNKQIDSYSSIISELNNDDHHLIWVIKLLRKASLHTASILNSLLQYLCSVPTTLKPKPTKWEVVLKLVHKRSVATFEGKLWEANNNNNELENVDVALSNIIMMVQQQSSKDDDESEMMIKKKKNIESAQEKLKALDGGIIEGFENALGCLFRRLIQARVALLNIISQ